MVDWKKEEGAFSVEVTLPANTISALALPVADYSNPTVQESGKTLFAEGALTQSADAITLIGYNKQRVFLKVGSGTYRFVVKDGE